MNDFTISGAWSAGIQFVARGTMVHFLILVLVGIAAPLALQYAFIGMPFDASPMAGQQIMRAMPAPVVLLTIALAHMLQSGSYFGALRFGFTDADAPGGALGYGLAAGFIATLVVAFGYVLAIVGGMAVIPTGSVLLVMIVLMVPIIVVYSLFFISAAIMGAAMIILTLAYMFVIAALNGYPVSLLVGGGEVVVILLLMSFLFFWLSARFSCVTAVMAQRGSPNVFEAIAESWRMTADEQWAIMRYLALVGFGVGVVIFGVSLALNAGVGGLEQGGGLEPGGVGDVALRLIFGIPLAFLSVMLPAGIYRQLIGEETDVEVFE